MISEQIKAYPIVLSQDVIWGDMDAFGHINNTVYFRYFEDARMAYFEKTGVLEYKTETKLGPILARTECDFKLPLSFPDRIQIAASSKILGPKKILMDYLVASERFNAVVAKGQGLLLYYDYNTNKSSEIPTQIVDAIKSLEES